MIQFGCASKKTAECDNNNNKKKWAKKLEENVKKEGRKE